MTFVQLAREFKGMTGIQINEHAKELIGVELKLTGEIKKIEPGIIVLDYDSIKLPENLKLRIEYSNEKIHKQLLDMTFQDEIRLILKLTIGYATENNDVHATCNTSSVQLISTYSERERIKTNELVEREKIRINELERKHLNTRVFKSIGGTLGGILTGFLGGILVASVLQFGSCIITGSESRAYTSSSIAIVVLTQILQLGSL
jgi:hypothetical protein